MGQSLKKLTPGSEENIKEICLIVDKCYEIHFADPNKNYSLAEFYRAVCETVDEINKNLGYTQFRVPKTEKLEQAYNIHHKSDGKTLTREEFEKIIEEVIKDTGFSGFGAKDTLFYVFGVPLTTLLIKQRVIPKAIPNEIFIPVITSATVFILAKLNKL